MINNNINKLSPLPPKLDVSYVNLLHHFFCFNAAFGWIITNCIHTSLLLIQKQLYFCVIIFEAAEFSGLESNKATESLTLHSIITG